MTIFATLFDFRKRKKITPTAPFPGPLLGQKRQKDIMYWFFEQIHFVCPKASNKKLGAIEINVHTLSFYFFSKRGWAFNDRRVGRSAFCQRRMGRSDT